MRNQPKYMVYEYLDMIKKIIPSHVHILARLYNIIFYNYIKKLMSRYLYYSCI